MYVRAVWVCLILIGWAYSPVLGSSNISVLHSAGADSVTQAQVEQANAWIVQAQLDRRSGDFEQAQELLSRAAEIVEHSDDWTLNYRYNVENGQLNRTLGNFEEAERSFQKLFTLYNEEDHTRQIAANYTNLAIVYTSSGRYQQAMEALENSLEYRFRMPEDSLGLAITHKSVGEVHRIMRQHEKAYTAYSAALEYLGEQPNPLVEADLRYAMGILHNMMGLHSSARRYFEQVLAIGLEKENPGLAARGYSGLGEYYSAINQTRQSRENWIQAMDVMKGTGQPLLIGIYQAAIRESIRLYREDGRERWLQPVDDWMATFESMVDEFGSPSSRGELHTVKGDYHFARQNYAEAEVNLSAALDILEQIPRFRTEPVVYWKRAFNMMELNPSRGMELAEQAILLTDNYRRQTFFSGDRRAGYFKALSPYYARLAQRYIEHDSARPAEAFRVLDLNKSRAFAEDLKLKPFLAQDFLSQAQWERYRQLRNDMISLEAASLNLETPEERVEALDELEELNREAETIYNTMLSSNDELKQFLAPPAISLAEAREQLRPAEAGLQLGVYENQIAAVLFTKEETISWLTELPDTGINTFVNEVRGEITAGSPPEALLPRLQQAGERLFPAAARQILRRCDYLTIATDGTLAYLPFDALRLDGNYLTELLTIRYIPSFSVKQVLQQREQKLAGNASATPGRALALASPDFGNFERLPAYIREDNEALRPLPYSALEGRWIQEYFNGETRLLTGSEASEQQLLNELSQPYEILHLATHGIFDERSPQLSGIVLAQTGPEESAESQRPVAQANAALTRSEAPSSYSGDGFLRVGDIYDLSLSSELVVLSACNTGMGEIVDGEGVMGFKRAFLFSGAHSISVSLWSVQDRSTALLMRSFYQNISVLKQEKNQLSTLDYAEALRRARLELLRHNDYSHPMHWAAFTVTGG